MPRGIWRWWETKDGADLWWARIEEHPGQWSDIREDVYTRAGLTPSFWDLPLKEDHVAAAMGPSTVQQAQSRFEHEFVLPGIIIVMLAFCAVFVIGVVGYALLVQLGLLH